MERLILENQRIIMEALKMNTDNEWLSKHLTEQIEKTSNGIIKLVENGK